MIPRAVEQVFRVAEHMKTRGWEYSIEGEFLEIVGPSKKLLFHFTDDRRSFIVQRNNTRPPY
jgi:hypothetical protein